jgi:type IV secretion system T-DNA border endonuclease VirD2
MVLHTDQQHPHVHMVVKAEGDDRRRLHVDKIMLRQWRQDFARMMREQGIAANATPRVARGRNRDKTQDARYRAQRYGTSTTLRSTVAEIARELHATGTHRDPARPRLIETRRTVVKHWMTIADALDAQGAIVLAGDVRNFARHLPPALTQKELLATLFVDHLHTRDTKRRETAAHLDRSDDQTR